MDIELMKKVITFNIPFLVVISLVLGLVPNIHAQQSTPTGTTTATLTVSPTLTKVIDDDGDGVVNRDDECHNSNLIDTVIIDGCDSGVINDMANDISNGCSISDLIKKCEDFSENPRQFARCVSLLTIRLRNLDIIANSELGAIQECAASSDFGR